MLAMSSSSHRRIPSMSSWAIVVLIFVMPMMTCIPATESPIEHCLRLQMNPPPPPPQPSPAARGSLTTWGFARILCKDQFRVVGYYLRSTGKLPLGYLEALCNIFGDNEQKVKRFISDTFLTHDFQGLMAGRSCATIRKIKHPPHPSS